ncbi:MAG: N-acetyltransferase, partial [Saprospiraceae bacterium]|nr:N-acetyltransferase [Saprospiraceae bacterium]
MEFELRPIEMKDVDDLVKYANNLGISGNLTNKFPHPYTRKHGIRFINYANSQDPINVMGIIIDDHLSGSIG